MENSLENMDTNVSQGCKELSDKPDVARRRIRRD